MKIKEWLIVSTTLIIGLMSSGCFFSQHEILVKQKGRADISISFWFETGPMGSENQGRIGMSQLLFSFPEIQSYEMTTEVRKKGDGMFADEYLVYTFSKRDVDIKKNKFISFKKREDGSFLFIATFPKSVNNEVGDSENRHIVTLIVTLPAEIEMANTLNYEGRTAEWNLRVNDFTKEITLKAVTKPVVG